MPSPKHIELLEAVNNAKTEHEHWSASKRLEGFRMGLEDCRRKPDLMGCDLHYLDQGIDRPMCCGVFLDWEPSE